MLNVPMFSLFPIAASLSVSVDETGILMGSPDRIRASTYSHNLAPGTFTHKDK